MNNSELQVQARKILDTIAFMPEAIILRATEPPYNVQIPAEM
jgi:hypothetical protein